MVVGVARRHLKEGDHSRHAICEGAADRRDAQMPLIPIGAPAINCRRSIACSPPDPCRSRRDATSGLAGPEFRSHGAPDFSTKGGMRASRGWQKGRWPRRMCI